MAWNISTNLGDVDIENASVLEIERSSNELRVFLDFAKISTTGQSADNLEVIEKPCFFFQAVTCENFTGENATAARPLDLIEVVDYSPRKLVLSGYLDHKPWYEWAVESESLSILWKDHVANAT